MARLPKCPLGGRWYPGNVIADLGGAADIAGVDLTEAVLPRQLKDHPWVGRKVDFQRWNGYRDGEIIRCLKHPLGELMFDVRWPRLVPPILGGQPALVDHPQCWENVQRFFGNELRELTLRRKPRTRRPADVVACKWI